jgi:hypothetical protein
VVDVVDHGGNGSDLVYIDALGTSYEMELTNEEAEELDSASLRMPQPG